ncbi:hypothetical protein GCM10027399_12290 [Curvibacter fontanus]
MSLITRCPACRTMFKVVPDQLRISEGWVRCGKCEEIFDASAHMQEAVVPVAGAADAPDQEMAPFEGALAAAMASETRKADKRTGKNLWPKPRPSLWFTMWTWTWNCTSHRVTRCWSRSPVPVCCPTDRPMA